MTLQRPAQIRLIGLPAIILTAQAPVPAPLPALTSSYVQSMMVHAKAAANAVASGLRSPQWGTNIHNRLVDALSTHAEAPAEIVDGKFVNTTHSPSEAEKRAALASLASHEAKGRANGTNSSVCHVTETMTLAELDDYETGAQSLWPKIELPR
jgi:hypothetical protein